MNRFKLLAPALLAAAFLGTAGCNYVSSRPPARSFAASRPITYALAVSVHGGLQPTPAQWASLQAKFSKDLAAAGQVLVTDRSLADRIIRVDFFPNEDDPEAAGRAVIVSIRPNTLRDTSPASSLLAYRGAAFYPTAFGFGGNFLDSYYSMGSSYYGYGNSYYDGFSYGAPALDPTRPAPPKVKPTHPGHRHHHPVPGDPAHPVKCPPLLAAVPATTPSITGRVAYPPTEANRTAVLPTSFARVVSHRPTDPNTDRAERSYSGGGNYRGSYASSSSSAPENNSSWFGRLFSNSDSGGSGGTGYSRSTTEQTSSSAERTHSRSDRSSYTRSESGYTKYEPSYSRSDYGSSSSHSSPSSSHSSSSSSYSPPPASYSAPSYSPPAPSYSAPAYSPPPPSPSTTESSTTQNVR